MKKLILIPLILLGFTSCQKEEEVKPSNTQQQEQVIRDLIIQNGEIFYWDGQNTWIGPFWSQYRVLKGTRIRVYPYGCGELIGWNQNTGNPEVVGPLYCDASIIVQTVGTYNFNVYFLDEYAEFTIP